MKHLFAGPPPRSSGSLTAIRTSGSVLGLTAVELLDPPLLGNPNPISPTSRGVSTSLQCERELVEETPEELRMLLMLSELKRQANKDQTKNIRITAALKGSYTSKLIIIRYIHKSIGVMCNNFNNNDNKNVKKIKFVSRNRVLFPNYLKNFRLNSAANLLCSDCNWVWGPWFQESRFCIAESFSLVFSFCLIRIYISRSIICQTSNFLMHIKSY